MEVIPCLQKAWKLTLRLFLPDTTDLKKEKSWSNILHGFIDDGRSDTYGNRLPGKLVSETDNFFIERNIIHAKDVIKT